MKTYKNLDELKRLAIENDIKNTHLMKEETIVNKLKEINIEVVKEEDSEPVYELADDERIETDLAISDQLQKEGWFVTDIIRTGKDRPCIHKLKKMV